MILLFLLDDVVPVDVAEFASLPFRWSGGSQGGSVFVIISSCLPSSALLFAFGHLFLLLYLFWFIFFTLFYLIVVGSILHLRSSASFILSLATLFFCNLLLLVNAHFP